MSSRLLLSRALSTHPISMTSHIPFHPATQEFAHALAKREERAIRYQEKRSKRSSDPTAIPRAIIHRPWLTIPTTEGTCNDRRIKVFTWNLLAQCLVRRELFPTSDCLKASQRGKMLHEELLSQDADILCLQEVDRLEEILPLLNRAGYSHRFAASPGKKHGCLIAFKRSIFEQTHERFIFYDEQAVRDAGSERARCGHSFKTGNLGLILRLRFRDDTSNGVIVATTHLFWHPKYTYERARQAGILIKEIIDFGKTQGTENWPSFVAGDFNCPPNDAVYYLLTGRPLSDEHKDHLSHSRVTHISVDPSVPTTHGTVAKGKDEGCEQEETDPDRVITNARTATEEDGLLSDDELVALFAQGCQLQSAYNEGLSKIRDGSVTTFGDRASLQPLQPGYHEPAYTSYTHYWKSVLDYIFFVSQSKPCIVTGLLAPHQTKDFGSGLPKKGICASDHVSLAAEFSWASS